LSFFFSFFHFFSSFKKKTVLDSIVHFTENWSFPEECYLGMDNCYQADVILALGSSMLVQPAVGFPRKTLKNNGKLVIVTLQHTPYDLECFEKVFATTEEFMKMLMEELEIKDFDTTYDLLDNIPKEQAWANEIQEPKDPMQSWKNNNKNNNNNNNNNNEKSCNVM